MRKQDRNWYMFKEGLFSFWCFEWFQVWCIFFIYVALFVVTIWLLTSYWGGLSDVGPFPRRPTPSKRKREIQQKTQSARWCGAFRPHIALNLPIWTGWKRKRQVMLGAWTFQNKIPRERTPPLKKHPAPHPLPKIKYENNRSSLFWGSILVGRNSKTRKTLFFAVIGAWKLANPQNNKQHPENSKIVVVRCTKLVALSSEVKLWNQNIAKNHL